MSLYLCPYLYIYVSIYKELRTVHIVNSIATIITTQRGPAGEGVKELASLHSEPEY